MTLYNFQMCSWFSGLIIIKCSNIEETFSFLLYLFPWIIFQNNYKFKKKKKELLTLFDIIWYKILYTQLLRKTFIIFHYICINGVYKSFVNAF